MECITEKRKEISQYKHWQRIVRSLLVISTGNRRIPKLENGKWNTLCNFLIKFYPHYLQCLESIAVRAQSMSSTILMIGVPS